MSTLPKMVQYALGKTAHEVIPYSAEMRDAELIAEAIDVPAGELFKTLVVLRPPAKPVLVMVPADRQLDLKKLARTLGEKKVKMAGHDEAEALTGLKVGGISALALLNKGFVILLDASARAQEQILISGGQRGLDVKLAVKDLVKITGARLVDVS